MKELFDFVLSLIETAGPVAAGIAVILIIIIVGLRYTGVGFTVGAKTKLVDGDQIDGVAKNVEGIVASLDNVERRLTAVEKDVETRPTRKEIHDLELAFTKMEGRFESIDERTGATAHGVQRIENFMYEAAMRSRTDK